MIVNQNFVRTLQFYQLAEGATQATQLIVGQFIIQIMDEKNVGIPGNRFIMLPTLCYV